MMFRAIFLLLSFSLLALPAYADDESSFNVCPAVYACMPTGEVDTTIFPADSFCYQQAAMVCGQEVSEKEDDCQSNENQLLLALNELSEKLENANKKIRKFRRTNRSR